MLYRFVLAEMLEARTLFSSGFGPITKTGLTINPTHSAVQDNLISGPLLSGDFDGDGFADLVFGGQNPGNDAQDGFPHYLGVMLGSANGTFTDGGTLKQPGDAAILAYGAGDFNGDGNEDLAIIYSGPNNFGGHDYDLLIGMGYGDGMTFSPQPVIAFDATTFIPSGDTLPPVSMTVADFSGGGIDQIAVVIPTDAQHDWIDLLGYDSNHQLQRLSSTETGLPAADDQIVQGTFFKGDTHDLAIYDPQASKVETLANNGGSIAATGSVFSVTAPPASGSMLAAADVNQDGITDLVLQEPTGGQATNLVVLKNDGFGNLTELPAVSDNYSGTGLTALGSIHVASFQTSGYDQIFTRYGIFNGSGNGLLLPSGVSPNFDTDSNNAVIADFNGDGALDVVTQENTADGPNSIGLQFGSPDLGLTEGIVQVQDQSAQNAFGADINGLFHVSVSGADGTPTGTVDLYAVNTTTNAVTDLKTATLSNGEATIITPDLPIGSYSVIAVYSGDATFRTIRSDNVDITYVGGGSDAFPSGLLHSLIISNGVPSSVVTGTKSNKSVIVGISNVDSKLFKDSVTIDLFASLNSVIDPSDTLIGTVTKTIKLGPGKFTKLSVPVSLLASAPSGNYGILADTVENGMQTSVASGNGIPILDIAPPFVSLTPDATTATIKKDGSSFFAFTLTNQGNVATTGNTTFKVYASQDDAISSDDAVLVQKILSIRLKPGKRTKVKLNINPIETQSGIYAGTWIVQVTDQNGGVETAPATPLGTIT